MSMFGWIFVLAILVIVVSVAIVLACAAIDHLIDVYESYKYWKRDKQIREELRKK